jgi:hypothetical protein
MTVLFALIFAYLSRRHGWLLSLLTSASRYFLQILACPHPVPAGVAHVLLVGCPSNQRSNIRFLIKPLVSGDSDPRDPIRRNLVAAGPANWRSQVVLR